MSIATKLFLCLLLVLMVSLPVVAIAQEEAGIVSEVDQHEANVWDAKVEFYREWEFQQLMAEHIAATWRAKATFWQNVEQ